jgi:alpha-glucosidase
MTLNFPLLPALTGLDAGAARESWEWDAGLPTNAWLGNFVSNHDMAADRPGTRFAGEPVKLLAQTAWLLLGPGTPFVYYGNEIGQPQGPQRGDTRHRQPLDWEELNRQRDDPESLWHWHRRLIALRNDHASLRRGKAEFLTVRTSDGAATAKVLALWRQADGDNTLTVFNGSASSVQHLTIKMPSEAGEPALGWLLGTGQAPNVAEGNLELGLLAPYETRLLGWPD